MSFLTNPYVWLVWLALAAAGLTALGMVAASMIRYIGRIFADEPIDFDFHLEDLPLEHRKDDDDA